MEFEKLISSLDEEALARAAEALLRLLSGEGTAERASFLPASDTEREPRQSGIFPFSAPGAAEPLPGAYDAKAGALTAAEALSSFAAVPGGEAEERTRETARIEARPDADAERKPRSPEPVTAEAVARLEEQLAAVSDRNRRSLGTGPETVSPYASADGSATANDPAAGPSWSPAFSATRAAGFGAAAILGEADTGAALPNGGTAERDYFDAETVSEFFRRDSRRYDSGFSD